MKNRNPYREGNLKWHTGPAMILCATVILVPTLWFFYVGLPEIKHKLITSETRLVEGTETWEKWAKVRATVLIKFFVFNVTNPDAVVLDGSKFEMQEVGPYVWEEKRSKEILSVDEEEDTVTYKEIVWFHFRPDLSVGSQEDEVNVVNIPLYAVGLFAYKKLYSLLANSIIDSLMDEENETIVSTGLKIRDLVFDGVKLKPKYGELTGYLDVLPPEFHNGTFAFYNQKNGTPTVEWKINRGVNNHENFGQIHTYDGEKDVPWWKHPSWPPQEQYCNRINGSDGTIFPPFVKKDKRLFAFIPEICRSMYFTFGKEIDFHGIPAYQFVPAEEAMVNVLKNPDNACFCTEIGEDMENWCDDGNMPLFNCKAGVPIIVSNPHFLDSPDNITNAVGGMRPDRQVHQSEFIIEPQSGMFLRIAKRLQANLEYQSLPYITAFQNVPHTHVPVFWAEESAVQDDATIADLRFRLVTLMDIVFYTVWILVGISVLAVFVGITFVVKYATTRKQPSPNLVETRN